MDNSICVPYEEELKKNPELKESEMQALRDWCAKQPHLPKISDSELALFLHSNYYKLEPTKSTIDTFYTIRTHVPEFFANRDPVYSAELRKIFSLAAILPLEKRTKEGYTVLVGKLVDTDASNWVYNDHMKYLSMCIDLWMYENGSTNGHILLFDTAGVAIGHAARINPMGLKKFLCYLQDGLPVRLKAMHFTSMNPVMETILNMMRPFMKKELLDVLQLHSSVDTLDKFVPLDILPEEFGGKAGSIKDLHKEQIKKLQDHRDWFLEEESRARVDESKRLDKTKNASSLFGVEGSFKKLDID
ncbi:hypothetical protein QAD02_012229 [Eretmocerus hayati]|uniref:Uncharacterized protein n=1 Tax=Eretmocerus hayati TaxID=131215 RepID=A0ACC2NZ76_9HYME|nr:hypothetical protein QAD02_012229 [Eretmocerus hayati]